ncbi:hypothetical protein MNBD_GAMMA12-270 [hydrothermal vent metagenome]|uniref:peptidyl-tRNA hydrolase n=1 Tax=hydrothermal vent metagenome TaxID=652676 RepID=A0A3B0YZA9_9ZZZZ
MKQIIVVNLSLRLPNGKLAAQVAHASVASLLITEPEILSQWLEIGMPKIALKANDDSELLGLHERAEEAGIPSQLIRDAGKTVVTFGTITCLGLGPAKVKEIDAVTKELKLL